MDVRNGDGPRYVLGGGPTKYGWTYVMEMAYAMGIDLRMAYNKILIVP